MIEHFRTLRENNFVLLWTENRAQCAKRFHYSHFLFRRDNQLYELSNEQSAYKGPST